MQKLSIIIPVFNEKNTVNQVLEKVSQVKLDNFSKEIICIDDGSTDGTEKIVRKWDKKIKVIRKIRNEGKGSAIITGLKCASGSIIIIQDADLEYDPQNYPALLTPFNNPNVNVVYGSRFLGPHLSTMFVYALGNRFVTLVTNILFNTNITDMETGYKALRKSVIETIGPLGAKRFDFEPEVTARVLKHGYQIYEVPITYYGRKFADGKKLTWRDGVAALVTLVKLRLSLSK